MILGGGLTREIIIKNIGVYLCKGENSGFMKNGW